MKNEHFAIPLIVVAGFIVRLVFCMAVVFVPLIASQPVEAGPKEKMARPPGKGSPKVRGAIARKPGPAIVRKGATGRMLTGKKTGKVLAPVKGGKQTVSGQRGLAVAQVKRGAASVAGKTARKGGQPLRLAVTPQVVRRDASERARSGVSVPGASGGGGSNRADADLPIEQARTACLFNGKIYLMADCSRHLPAAD